MTFQEWKDRTKKEWHILAGELTDIMATFGHHDKLYLNRLNRLRAGTEPTKHEVRALLIMTRNNVDSFKN